MTRKEKNLLLSYFYNNETRLSLDVKQLQANLRYRKIDEVDCIELMIATVRLETFIEVSKNVRSLLKLSALGGDEDEEL